MSLFLKSSRSGKTKLSDYGKIHPLPQQILIFFFKYRPAILIRRMQMRLASLPHFWSRPVNISNHVGFPGIFLTSALLQPAFSSATSWWLRFSTKQVT